MLVKNKKSLTIYLTVLAAILLLLNLISRNWYKRFDLTDNKMYSLSNSSEDIVDKIDDLLTMKVYFSDDLPGELSNTKRYLQDLLEEYEAKIIAIPIIKEITWLSVTALEKTPIDAYTDPTRINPR